MARPLRIEYEGALYHVTSRGNRREPVFDDDVDRGAFLRVLEEVVRRFRWICHAYCLMGNHYHLLVETPEANLSKGMRHLNGVYTQGFNARHGHVGHVFQGRYKAILIEKERHLLEVTRYVVLNPVRAGLASRAQAWRWSSYRATAGLCAAPTFLATDGLLARFGDGRVQSQQAYRRFVREGTHDADLWKGLVGGFLLGAEEFVSFVRGRMSRTDSLGEIPRREKLAGRLGLAQLLAGGEVPRNAKDQAARAAHTTFGYTMKEIADYLGVHYATVSRAIRRAERENV